MTGTQTRPVDPTNAEQAKAWDGDEGDYWADHAERFETTTSRYDRHLLAAAGLTAASHVIDVGCGTGDTARAAAATARTGTVLGIDLSHRMLAVARRRAELAGIDNVRFVPGDAQIYPFDPATADVVISKTGTMFFGDPVAAFGNLGRALAPGGRLAVLVWQPVADNEWFREITTALAAGRKLPMPPPDAPGPFSMSDPSRVRGIVEAAGFGDLALDDLREPMDFGPDATSAYEFALGLLDWMLDGLDATGRAVALDALRATMTRHETDSGVDFGSAMWLVTAVRR
jgi:SAM-dependent methyltransferase